MGFRIKLHFRELYFHKLIKLEISNSRVTIEIVQYWVTRWTLQCYVKRGFSCLHVKEPMMDIKSWIMNFVTDTKMMTWSRQCLKSRYFISFNKILLNRLPLSERFFTSSEMSRNIRPLHCQHFFPMFGVYISKKGSQHNFSKIKIVHN